MKKKIFAVLGAAAMMTLGIDVFAQTPQIYVSVSAGGEYVFKLSGATLSGESGKTVNIIIFNPDKGFEDKNDKKALQYQTSVETGENGIYDLEIPINFDGENDTGWYTVYISGEDYNKALDLSVFAADEDSKIRAIKELGELIKPKDSDDLSIEERIEKIKECIVTNENILSLTGMGYEQLDKAELAKLVFANKDVSGFLDKEDTSGTIRRLKQLIIVECFNQEKTSALFDADTFLYPDYIDFSQIDVKGVTLYDAYVNIVKDKQSMINSILNKDISNVDELMNEFAKAAFVKAIADPATGGSGHVANVLTDKNAERVGIDVSKYLSAGTKNKTAVETGLTRAKYAKVEDIENYVKNYDYSQSSSSGSNSGSSGSSGSSNGNGGLPVAGGIGQVTAPSENNDKLPFKDISNVAWAHEAIESLYNSGVINGVSDTEFNPMGNVTREQFVVMLMRAMTFAESSQEMGFSDVLKGQYYSGYIQAAQDAGIVNGISDTEFGVGLPIKRQDIAVIIKNTVDYMKRNLDKVKDVTFEDTVDDYAVEAVELLSGAGIINGFEDNTFRGYETCTRAQAAKLLYETLKAIN